MERMDEADLVRESLYALQGLPSAVRSLEHLSSVYLATDADLRALRAAGTIWSRSASSNALGKLLLEFANAGRVRCSVDLFVNFFLDDKPSFSTGLNTRPKPRGCSGSIAAKAQRKQVKELQRKRWAAYRQVKLASRGLVNQAFAKAVRSISLGHNNVLSTLLDSVSQRRSGSRNPGFDNRFKNGKDGAGGPIVLRDVTLLELFLHTKELRNQLQALARICFSQRDFNPGWTSDFFCGEPYVIETADGRIRSPSMEQLVVLYSQWHDFLLVVQEFPRGATLLSYLHSKLLDADSLQANVLRFLFARAWRPYSVFVDSWLYHAAVTDPYAEFIVEEWHLSKSMHLSSYAENLEQELPAELKIRAEECLPSFLREVSKPLIRAGQQLQVLLKLPETRDFAQQLAGYIFLTDPTVASQETMGCLWSEQHNKSSLFSTLGFSKQKLDNGLQLREERSRVMTEHFNELFKALMLKEEKSSQTDEDDRSTDQPVADSFTGELFRDSISEFLDASQAEDILKSDFPSLHSIPLSMEMEHTLRTDDVQSSSDKCSCDKPSEDEQTGAGKDSESDHYTLHMVTPACSSNGQTEQESTEEENNLSAPQSLVSQLPVQEKIYTEEENTVYVPQSLAPELPVQEQVYTESVICVSSVAGTCEDSGPDKVTPLSIGRKSDYSNKGIDCEDIIVTNVDENQSSQQQSTSVCASGTVDSLHMLATTSFLDSRDLSVEMNSLLVTDSENEVLGLQSTESLLSDYLKEIWSVSGLPNNPFLVSSDEHSAVTHMYRSISFPECEKNWDLDTKLQDKGVYSKRYFQQVPRDPLRRERRVLAELPFGNYAEFPFLDKHLTHSPEKLLCGEAHDGSSYKGGFALQQIEHAANDKDAACTQVALHHSNPHGSSDEIRNNIGLGDVFEYLNKALSREGMNRRNWQLNDIPVVETLKKSVLESVQSLSGKSFEEPLRPSTTASTQEGQESKLENEDALGHAYGNSVNTDGTIMDAQNSGHSVSDIHVESDYNGTGNHFPMEENGFQAVTRNDWFPSWYVHGENAHSTSQISERAAERLQAQEKTDSGIDGEIPFAIVLDKCIIQEILLQYQSVSLYTVKILQDVLHLRDHYAALRRYFFMETADWADNFVAALSKHKWGLLRGQSELLVVQGMLESSLQRSSCEGDEFAERLFIASIGANDLTANPSGIVDSGRLKIFEGINLGYRVNWPLTLVLTSSALNRYGAIFSYLVGIKSTVHILSSIHQSLKGIRHDLKDYIARCQHQKNCFRMLQVFRWQVCHFVTSLQRYLESKLLHVVWSRFLQSTELQEKDIYDLEALHSEYLDEAESCCFVSKATTSVKASVDRILQLVVDFETHLRIASSDVDSNVLSELLYSQAFRLNMIFQECIRHLHSCSIRPEYRSSLSDFWMCLDHNGFFAKAYSKFHH